MSSVSAINMSQGMTWLPTQASQPVPISPKVSEQASQDTVTRPGRSRESDADGASKSSTAPSLVQDEQTPPDAEQAQRQVEQVVMQLKMRDQEVRAHEQAHLAAAGAYARGGISYDYQTGPDGRKYAVGGSVGIDTSPVKGDPQATMQKAMIVQRAALAPAQPSPQDMRVAAQAAQMMMQAQSEIQAQRLAGDESQDSQLSETAAQEQVNAGAQKGAVIADTDNQSPRGEILPRALFDVRLAVQGVAESNNADATHAFERVA